jgi:hypothetical protein
MMPGKVCSAAGVLDIVHAVLDEVIIGKFVGAIGATVERLTERAQRVLDDHPVLWRGHSRDIITAFYTRWLP